MSADILIVDSDPAHRRHLSAILQQYAYQPREVASVTALRASLADIPPPALILLEVATAGPAGIAALDHLRVDHPEIPVIALTAAGDVDAVAASMRAGATDFLSRPLSAERLMVSLEKSLKISALEGEVTRLKNATSSAFAVQTANLTKKYGTQVALADLSLEIAYGEIFGLLGHNGAGKTTMIHILTTLLAPTAGTARICGFDVQSESLSARRTLGYVPENVRLYEGMSARENLLFFARLSGIDQPDRCIHETLSLLDSTNLADKQVGLLSKGQRQRIGLAQAILHQPKVLFLDEPTSGLDPLGIKTVRELIVRLNRDLGMTVFMNTHVISEVAKTCTTIGILSRGKLVYRDTIDAIMSRFKDDVGLETLYLSLHPRGTDLKVS